MLEPEPKKLDAWSWRLKFGFRFLRDSLWGKQVVPILQRFLVFCMDQIILEPESQNLDACSWSLKFEFRLHSPGCT